MQDRTLRTPKSPADVDRLIEDFHSLYGRHPSREERETFEYIRQLLTEKESAASQAAAADD